MLHLENVIKIKVKQTQMSATIQYSRFIMYMLSFLIICYQFAESEWCQWEIDLVQERRRRQGKKALVLIMYRQIDSRHMTSPLRTLLSTTPHLSYKEGIGEILFWNTVIRDVANQILSQ
jgi:hypothetical protein